MKKTAEKKRRVMAMRKVFKGVRDARANERDQWKNCLHGNMRWRMFERADAGRMDADQFDAVLECIEMRYKRAYKRMFVR